MINSEKISKKINKKIKMWLKDHSKLVIAIDGYAGSGKTTIANFIGKHNSNTLIVHLDDFIKHFKVRKRMISNAKDKSKVFESQWYHYDSLEKLIKEFKTGKQRSIKLKVYNFDKNNFLGKKSFDLSKKILVINGIFLFYPKNKISKLFDKKIYIKTDFNKADRRRILRERKKWGKAYLPETHTDNWTKYFKKAYRNYIKKYKPQNKADILFRV